MYSCIHTEQVWHTTHIDEVLLEALAQVLYEGGLAGVVLQQDKVLHAHPVSGCQGRLHHSPHPVTSHHLEEDKEGVVAVSDWIETARSGTLHPSYSACPTHAEIAERMKGGTKKTPKVCDHITHT